MSDNGWRTLYRAFIVGLASYMSADISTWYVLMYLLILLSPVRRERKTDQ